MKNHIHKQLCGCKIDGINFTFPFTGITLYSQSLTLKCFSKKINLEYKYLERVYQQKHFLFYEIHLIHNNKTVPKNIIIRPIGNNKKLYNLLNKLNNVYK